MTSIRLIVLACATLTLVGCGGAGPESTAKKAMDALENGEVGALAQLMGPDGLIGSDYPEAVRVQRAAGWIVRVFEGYEGIEKYELEDVEDFEINGDIARVEASATCKKERRRTTEDGETREENIELDVTINLLQYKGKWRVMDIDFEQR